MVLHPLAVSQRISVWEPPSAALGDLWVGSKSPLHFGSGCRGQPVGVSPKGCIEPRPGGQSLSTDYNLLM